ncbi:receiver/sensor box histidine kinase [Natrinema versiforme]|uniref:histidine kinase n=1 Tax=Natrinema versiforme JCM 10478 TaxID=1227496 RepID=L9XX49_9EURY|nr:ATP-binding protein [Natrinema versiforme]ELY65188.1 multi-sensor signal transduction histidine kinase [Natrinema versiforme JCM 10478]
MTVTSNRFVGRLITVIGGLLTTLHLVNVVRFETTPVRVLIDGAPILLSIVVAIAGALLARDRLVPNQFVGRLLAWAGAGVLAVSTLGTWLLGSAVIIGIPLVNPFVPMLNVATFGALAGLLVGVYDVRGLERQQSIKRLNRINDTIRIATQEVVNKTDRADLEQAVCDRLSESEPYEGVWIGRYEDGTERVRPAAWAGLDDEYVESITVTIDDSPTGGGAGGRAIKTGEIQCVPDVFADPTMEPWWDLLESRGVQSLAVVPIVHGETVYGFFSIYADRQNVFDEHEQEVLTELGETIGHAVASIEARRRLADHERELARQNERLDAFAGVVSHDLRNPLNVATGHLELAREQRDGDGNGNGERVDENLSQAAEALDRMEDLIQDLLTLSRQGKTVDECRSVPLQPTVDRAWSTIEASEARLRIDGDLGTISCDQKRLRQLLENLFRNSIEHAGPDATVTVRRTSVGFVVEDDGPGIPPEERQTVFEMGYTTNDDGTGFGLNIVRSIADAHGWDVSVGESPEGGARFEFAGVEEADSPVRAA